MNEETFDARMERLLRTLPPALRGMGFGDPDDVEYAHASDVVAWAIREIARLRESLAIFVHAHATGNIVPPHLEAAAKELVKEVGK